MYYVAISNNILGSYPFLFQSKLNWILLIIKILWNHWEPSSLSIISHWSYPHLCMPLVFFMLYLGIVHKFCANFRTSVMMAFVTLAILLSAEINHTIFYFFNLKELKSTCDSELQKLHKEFVISGILTESEFWATRKVSLMFSLHLLFDDDLNV